MMTEKDTDIFDDLDALRTDQADFHPQQPAPAPKSRKWRREFIRFPWVWLERMQGVERGSTFKLALWLLYETWRNGGAPIVLSNRVLKQAGLLRASKWRGLRELEALGLVTIERRPRRSPVIATLHTGAKT